MTTTIALTMKETELVDQPESRYVHKLNKPDVETPKGTLPVQEKLIVLLLR